MYTFLECKEILIDLMAMQTNECSKVSIYRPWLFSIKFTLNLHIVLNLLRIFARYKEYIGGHLKCKRILIEPIV